MSDDSDEEERRKLAAVVFVTPRGILGQYFDPHGQDRTEADIEERAAHVIIVAQHKLH
jgi:hypothetical protein